MNQARDATGTEIFARLDHARRVWAVASIHADAARLRRLHDAIGERFRPGDRLVYLGNMIGRGAEPAETIAELLAFRRLVLAMPGMEPDDIVFLRGMQEEMWRKLQEIHFAQRPAEVFPFMLREGVGPLLDAYGVDRRRAEAAFRAGVVETVRWTGALRDAMRRAPGHDDLLAHLRRAAFTAGGELLFVSAGLDPHRPLDAQGDAFWWGHAGFADVQEPYAGFRLVVRGFDRARQPPRFGPATATIDGGAGFGGPLNAACFTLDGAAVDWIEIE